MAKKQTYPEPDEGLTMPGPLPSLGQEFETYDDFRNRCAIAAMQAFIEADPHLGLLGTSSSAVETRDQVVAAAFRVADAMVKARG